LWSAAHSPGRASVLTTLLVAAVLSGVAGGCGRKRFTQDLTLGGQRLSAATLNQGHAAFGRFCAACHGERGDGQGAAAQGTVPPPRNFTLGYFKYTSVKDGGLPTDADLFRSVTRGLAGTRMPPWTGASRADLQAAVHYLKTFSPRWRERTVGEPVEATRDPWAAADPTAPKRGEAVYHGRAQCFACHPAYVPPTEIRQAVTQAAAEQGQPLPGRFPLRARLWRAVVVDTRHGPLSPPDFLEHTLHGGDENADLYRSVAAGIGGTPMPTWATRLPAGAESRNHW